MHLFRHIKPFHSNSHSYSPMGATISDFGSGRARRSPDCVINGFEYRIDGTYYSRNLVIGGEQGVGKSTLFRHLQKSSSVVRKEVTDPLFSTVIHWKNPYTGEMADVTSS